MKSNTDKGAPSPVDYLDGDVRYGLAFSGGSDSSYLLAALIEAGIDVKAYTVDSAFQADFELDDARRVAEQLGVQWQVITADVLAENAICENPPDRCYRCKLFIFGTILKEMEREGRTVLLDGTNIDDDPVRRPGFRALEELGVQSPLRQAGIGKQRIREGARSLGLFTAEKPSFSCYAVKVPEGELITAESLARAAEEPDQAKRAWMDIRGKVPADAALGRRESAGMNRTQKPEGAH